jgi:hypothetical protein
MRTYDKYEKEVAYDKIREAFYLPDRAVKEVYENLDGLIIVKWDMGIATFEILENNDWHWRILSSGWKSGDILYNFSYGVDKLCGEWGGKKMYADVQTDGYKEYLKNCGFKYFKKERGLDVYVVSVGKDSRMLEYKAWKDGEIEKPKWRTK